MANPSRYDAYPVGKSVWLNPDDGGPVFSLDEPVMLASEVDAWAAELRAALCDEREHRRRVAFLFIDRSAMRQLTAAIERATEATDALLGGG